MCGVEDRVERWDFTCIGDIVRVGVHYDIEASGNGTLGERHGVVVILMPYGRNA